MGRLKRPKAKEKKFKCVWKLAGGTVHDKRKDYKCDQCSAAFGQAGVLTRHVRTVHEKRRDYKCDQCSSAFGQSGVLKRPVLTVHEKRKDHACPVCAKAFGTARNRDVHVLTVHEKRRGNACSNVNDWGGKCSRACAKDSTSFCNAHGGSQRLAEYTSQSAWMQRVEELAQETAPSYVCPTGSHEHVRMVAAQRAVHSDASNRAALLAAFEQNKARGAAIRAAWAQGQSCVQPQ
jgi:DNA-directed RNA polymerase subunit RPC12/RpoP